MESSDFLKCFRGLPKRSRSLDRIHSHHPIMGREFPASSKSSLRLNPSTTHHHQRPPPRWVRDSWDQNRSSQVSPYSEASKLWNPAISAPSIFRYQYGQRIYSLQGFVTWTVSSTNRGFVCRTNRPAGTSVLRTYSRYLSTSALPWGFHCLPSLHMQRCLHDSRSHRDHDSSSLLKICISLTSPLPYLNPSFPVTLFKLWD